MTLRSNHMFCSNPAEWTEVFDGLAPPRKKSGLGLHPRDVTLARIRNEPESNPLRRAFSGCTT